MNSRNLLALFALLGAVAARADSGSAPSPMIEVLPPEALGRTAIVVLPGAARSILDRLAHDEPGQDAWIAVNLEAGSFNGLRVQMFPWTGEHMNVAVEGMVGSHGGPAAGAGVRVEFRVASGCRQAVYVSPGVDLYFAADRSPELGNYSAVSYLATDVDVSWLYRFGYCCSVFEAGLRLGGQVQMASWGSQLLPEIGVFTGVRF